jgi:type IV secretory pathway component VirB8
MTIAKKRERKRMKKNFKYSSASQKYDDLFRCQNYQPIKRHREEERKKFASMIQ